MVVEDIQRRPTVSCSAQCVAECRNRLDVCRDVLRCAETVRDTWAWRDIVRKWKNGVFHWWGSSSPISGEEEGEGEAERDKEMRVVEGMVDGEAGKESEVREVGE